MESCRRTWEVEYLTTCSSPPKHRTRSRARKRDALRPYFTNTDRPVFALINLPETVKGALFARYSRSAKSLRRLFLDEFRGDVPATGDESAAGAGVGTERADRLYARVLNEYGDDSVAQLGGAHIACEGVSNMLTKVLEWGRLMAYLEQSTRYVPYTDRPNGRWKYHVPGGSRRDRRSPPSSLGTMDLRVRDVRALDSGDGSAFPGEVSEGAERFRRRVSIGDSRQSARHAARTAAGGDHVECRPVRDRSGVRGAAAADVRASARGGARRTPS